MFADPQLKQPAGPPLYSALLDKATGLLAILFVLAYGGARVAYGDFYRELGLTPEDAGLSQAQILATIGKQLFFLGTVLSLVGAGALVVYWYGTHSIRRVYPSCCPGQSWLAMLLGNLLGLMGTLAVFARLVWKGGGVIGVEAGVWLILLVAWGITRPITASVGRSLLLPICGLLLQFAPILSPSHLLVHLSLVALTVAIVALAYIPSVASLSVILPFTQAWYPLIITLGIGGALPLAGRYHASSVLKGSCYLLTVGGLIGLLATTAGVLLRDHWEHSKEKGLPQWNERTRRRVTSMAVFIAVVVLVLWAEVNLSAAGTQYGYNVIAYGHVSSQGAIFQPQVVDAAVYSLTTDPLQLCFAGTGVGKRGFVVGRKGGITYLIVGPENNWSPTNTSFTPRVMPLKDADYAVVTGVGSGALC